MEKPPISESLLKDRAASLAQPKGRKPKGSVATSSHEKPAQRKRPLLRQNPPEAQSSVEQGNPQLSGEEVEDPSPRGSSPLEQARVSSNSRERQGRPSTLEEVAGDVVDYGELSEGDIEGPSEPTARTSSSPTTQLPPSDSSRSRGGEVGGVERAEDSRQRQTSSSSATSNAHALLAAAQDLGPYATPNLNALYLRTYNQAQMGLFGSSASIRRDGGSAASSGGRNEGKQNAGEGSARSSNTNPSETSQGTAGQENILAQEAFEAAYPRVASPEGRSGTLATEGGDQPAGSARLDLSPPPTILQRSELSTTNSQESRGAVPGELASGEATATPLDVAARARATFRTPHMAYGRLDNTLLIRQTFPATNEFLRSRPSEPLGQGEKDAVVMETAQSLHQWYCARHLLLTSPGGMKPPDTTLQFRQVRATTPRPDIIRQAYDFPLRFVVMEDNRYISREVMAAEIHHLSILEAAILQYMREHAGAMPSLEDQFYGSDFGYYVMEMIIERYRLHNKDRTLLDMEQSRRRYQEGLVYEVERTIPEDLVEATGLENFIPPSDIVVQGSEDDRRFDPNSQLATTLSTLPLTFGPEGRPTPAAQARPILALKNRTMAEAQAAVLQTQAHLTQKQRERDAAAARERQRELAEQAARERQRELDIQASRERYMRENEEAVAAGRRAERQERLNRLRQHREERQRNDQGTIFNTRRHQMMRQYAERNPSGSPRTVPGGASPMRGGREMSFDEHWEGMLMPPEVRENPSIQLSEAEDQGSDSAYSPTDPGSSKSTTSPLPPKEGDRLLDVEEEEGEEEEGEAVDLTSPITQPMVTPVNARESTASARSSGTTHQQVVVVSNALTETEAFVLDIVALNYDLRISHIHQLERSYQESVARGRSSQWRFQDHLTTMTLTHLRNIVDGARLSLELRGEWWKVYAPPQKIFITLREAVRVIGGRDEPAEAARELEPLSKRIISLPCTIDLSYAARAAGQYEHTFRARYGDYTLEDERYQADELKKVFQHFEKHPDARVQALFRLISQRRPRTLEQYFRAFFSQLVEFSNKARDAMLVTLASNTDSIPLMHLHVMTSPAAKSRSSTEGSSRLPLPIAANNPVMPRETSSHTQRAQPTGSRGQATTSVVRAAPHATFPAQAGLNPPTCNRCNRYVDSQGNRKPKKGGGKVSHTFHQCPYRFHPDCNNDEFTSWEMSEKGKIWALAGRKFLEPEMQLVGTDGSTRPYRYVIPAPMELQEGSKPSGKRARFDKCKSASPLRDQASGTLNANEQLYLSMDSMTNLSNQSLTNINFVVGRIEGKNGGPSCEVSVLLDTGAFHGNYISVSLANWLVRHNHVVIQPCMNNITICGISDSWCTQCIGEVITSVMLKPELSSTLINIKISAKVLDGAFDIVIGRPTIKKENLVAWFPSQFLHIDEKLRNVLASWVCSCMDNKALPAEEGGSSNTLTEPQRILNDIPASIVLTNRTFLNSIKEKEELLTSTPPGEAWLRDPQDINDVLQGESEAKAREVDEELREIGVHGPSELQVEIRKLCSEYADIFSSNLRDEPAAVPPMQLNVDLGKWQIPKNRRPYRVQSPAKESQLKKILDKLLQRGLIRPSKAQFWSQVLLVPKPTPGEYRLCIDYRNLNDASRGEHWPLPNLDQLVERAGRRRAQFMGKMDLTSGFWQTLLSKPSTEFTAFITFMGLFEWIRVPMGLKGAPSFFQQSMASLVLAGLLYVVCELYIDDVIVFGTTQEDFINNLRAVFERFREYRVLLNPAKCCFGTDTTEFVGHVIDAHGKSMSAEKIQKVLSSARPTTIKELRSFLGLVNYFRTHIDHHSDRIRALLTLLKKHTGSDEIRSKRGNNSRKPISWNEAAEAAFQDILRAVANCPKLFFLRDEGEHQIILSTDASDFAYGAYLSQNVDGVEYPIAFSSKTFSQDQLKWSVPEKEAFGIYHAIMHFEFHLRDRQFILRTDHKNLTYINESGSPKVIRWKLAIMEFNFKVEYVKGTENLVADYFSRVRPAEEERVALLWYEPSELPEDRKTLIESQHSATWASEDDLGRLVLHRAKEIINRLSEEDRLMENNNKRLFITEDPNTDDYRLLAGSDPSVRQQLTLWESKDSKLNPTFSAGASPEMEVEGINFNLPTTTASSQRKKKRNKRVAFIDGLTSQETTRQRTANEPEAVVENNISSEEVQGRIAGNAERAHFQRIHELFKKTHGCLPGHHGVERTVQKVLRHLEAKGQQPWDGIYSDVSRFIRNCPFCQKMSHIKPIVNSKPFTLASRGPWERINIDAMGPFPETPDGYQHIIVIIDCFTRFVELLPARSTGAAEAKQAILSVIGRYGVPAEIVTDSGSQFRNETIKTMITMMGTTHSITLAYSKEENAMVERANKEVLRHLSALVYETRIKEDWIDFLPLVQRIINATPHGTTGVAPAQLLFGNSVQLDRGIFLPIEKMEGINPTDQDVARWMDKMLTKQAELLKVAEKNQQEKDARNLRKRSKEEYTEFPINSYVLVAYPHSRMGQRPPVKTMTPYRGPLRVVNVNGSKYTLQNLVTLKEERVHVSLLKKFEYDPETEDPVEVARRDTQEFEVEEILKHRGNFQNKSSLEFKVRWKNYGPEDDTWEPWANVRANEKLHEYLRQKGFAKHIPRDMRASKDAAP